MIRDENKEKPLEIEMGWLCSENGFKQTPVPKQLVAEAAAAGKAKAEGNGVVGSVDFSSGAATEEKAMELAD